MTSLRKIFAAPALAIALGGATTPRAARAQTAATTIPVTVFGEIRSRSEGDWPGGALATDFYSYLRSRLGIRAEPTHGVRIVAQVQDSRVFGAEGNASATNPDMIELHQGYLELGGGWVPRDFLVRVGRQEVIFGNERLVGASDWSNTARSFDGARVLLTPRGSTPGAEQWTATLFAATVEERGRKFGATTTGATSAPLPDHAVAGLFATRIVASGSLDATALYDAGSHYRTYSRSNRATFDSRLRQGTNHAVGFELEAAWQTGSQQYQAASTLPVVNQDVSAWLLGAKLMRPEAAGRRVTGAIGVDVLSGDAKATDGTYGAFNTMFATNHQYYGLMDLLFDPAQRTDDRGLVDALARMAVALPPRTTLKFELHHFSPQAGDHAEIGWEGDAIVPVRISAAATVELGYTAFRAGPAAQALALGVNGAWRHWAYLQLKVGF
jgi:hypothetical protein